MRAKDYFDAKNEEFFDFLDDMFGISKSKNWDDIARNVTLLKIKRTYRVFAELFPRNMDYLQELEKSKSEFTSIHWGALKASKIINEVTRFSLYSDKILVFHPLQNPAVTNQLLDPGKKPKYWLPDFLEALYFYIVIQKWVKEGIVKLIVNPCEYNMDLRNETDSRTHQRLSKVDAEQIFQRSKNEVLGHLAEPFALPYRNKKLSEIVDELLNLHNPKFSKAEAEDLAKEIIGQIPYINPLYNKLNIPLTGGMVVPTKGGGSLDAMMVVAQYTGGSLFTPSASSWEQIKDLGENDFWTKTGHLYSKIPLNFLNNVDTSFALEIRKEDRLAGVRKQLKAIYSELDTLDMNEISEVKIKELHESFIEEVKVAEAEWKEIKKQAELARKHWLAASVGIPIMVNEISIWPLLATSSAWLFMNERSKIEKQKLQRVKNPISVFVDLKNQRQNYFSMLKNCLL
ncbi:MAG: hypothetical protein EOO20_05480 [Chryseobacterium sp.]|nr:MAG: hypothetical protein EOO20_05480 [Chryseobacterium sp.]